MGFHLASLLNHQFAKQLHNDYIEMMVHNLAAAYLFAFSYMSNTFIGILVAFLFSIADVLICWTRMCAETKYKRLSLASFVVL